MDDNDYLAHIGRSFKDGAPVGSGRYRLGSGKVPFQHTRNAKTKQVLSEAKDKPANQLKSNATAVKDFIRKTVRPNEKDIDEKIQKEKDRIALEEKKQELKKLKKTKGGSSATKYSNSIDNITDKANELSDNIDSTNKKVQGFMNKYSNMSNADLQNQLNRLKSEMQLQEAERDAEKSPNRRFVEGILKSALKQGVTQGVSQGLSKAISDEVGRRTSNVINPDKREANKKEKEAKASEAKEEAKRKFQEAKVDKLIKKNQKARARDQKRALKSQARWDSWYRAQSFASSVSTSNPTMSEA